MLVYAGSAVLVTFFWSFKSLSISSLTVAMDDPHKFMVTKDLQKSKDEDTK